MRVSQQIESERIARWLRVRGLGDRTIVQLADIGFVNRVYLIGSDLVLRITKNVGDAEDALTETVAVPVAVEAGLKTPALIEFDDSKSIFQSVVSLYEKSEGLTMGRQSLSLGELPSLYLEVGEQLGILHREVKVCSDPNGYLDIPESFNPRALLDHARTSRKVEAVSFDWVSRWLDILEPGITPRPDNVFLHNDLHSFNVMVHLEPLRLSAILDWGDAGWGDPALEFGTMPIWAVDWILSSYEKSFRPVDEGFFARLLWHDLGAALEASINLWVETDEPWQPLTTSRWINLARLFAHPKDPRWAQWLPTHQL
jgi:hygromycin-B 7''-O-kinase